MPFFLGENHIPALLRGPVLEVLAAVLREEQADLLLLGYEKRSFFEKALFQGSVEEHVSELKTGVEVSIVT